MILFRPCLVRGAQWLCQNPHRRALNVVVPLEVHTWLWALPLQKPLNWTTIQCILKPHHHCLTLAAACSRDDVSFSHPLQHMRPYLLPQLGIKWQIRNPYPEDIVHSRINLLNYTNLGMSSECLGIGNPGHHFYYYVHSNLYRLSIFTPNMWKPCYGSFLEALCIWQPYRAPNSSTIIHYEDKLGPTIIGTFYYSRNSAILM